jgi:hypothetical protein
MLVRPLAQKINSRKEPGVLLKIDISHAKLKKVGLFTIFHILGGNNLKQFFLPKMHNAIYYLKSTLTRTSLQEKTNP